MNVKIKKGKIGGIISAIPSKSYAHRISICNFLSGKEPTARCNGFSSNDIAVTETCLKTLLSGGKTLDAGESGSTLRFLLPLVAALGGEYEFIGHGKLMERPNEELFSVFALHGVSAKKDKTIKVKGKLSSGEYRIRGDISSQYISGLLMALPILDGDSEIVLTTPLCSAPYVDITLEVLSAFGVKIDKLENGYKVYGNQKYFGVLAPEGDWSNMAFFLVLGALNGKLSVTGMNLNSVQGDKKIIEILKLAGASVTIENGVITVKESNLKPFVFDAEDCPDLVPITAALAACATGKSVINSIERLKIKESDRVESTIALLKAFNIKSESDGHSLTVYGGNPKAGEVDSFNDHRIVMTAAVLASVCDGESKIINAKAVNKSYPSFFNDYNSVGGNADEF